MSKSYAEIFAELGREIVASRRVLVKPPVARAKSSWGGFVAAGIGVAVIAGAAYFAWQILHTDDEAWVDDDFDVD